MILSGKGRDGSPLVHRFFIIASSGHGPYIPCMPAVIMARRLAKGGVQQRGAMPCVDLIDLATYTAALEGLDISIVRDVANA